MRYLKIILSVLVVLFIIVLIIENNGALSTKVYFVLDMFSLHYRSIDISIYYIASVMFLSGVFVTGIFGMVDMFQMKKQIKGLYKIIREKDKELNSLRNLPITSDAVVSGNIDDIIK
jgi:hypothetical protein